MLLDSQSVTVQQIQDLPFSDTIKNQLTTKFLEKQFTPLYFSRFEDLLPAVEELRMLAMLLQDAKMLFNLSGVPYVPAQQSHLIQYAV